MQIEGCSTKVRRTRKYDNDDDMNTHRQHVSKKKYSRAHDGRMQSHKMAA